jgi:hypothetical protein
VRNALSIRPFLKFASKLAGIRPVVHPNRAVAELGFQMLDRIDLCQRERTFSIESATAGAE